MLFLSLLFGIPVFSQDKSRVNFTMEAIFGNTLKYTNEYTKSMVKPVNGSNRIKADYFIGKSFKNSIGLGLGGGSQYNDPNKEFIIQKLNENGNQIFGDLILNDWTEWHFGLNYSHYEEIHERFNVFVRA